MGDISALTFADPQHGWAIGECSDYDHGTKCTILATRDGGRTWRSQHRSIGRLRTLQFLDAQHGFAIATGADSSIVATADGGRTWTRRDLARNLALNAVDFVTPQQGFALASGVIFQTIDGGQTWIFDYGSASCSFAAISFATRDAGMAAGSGQDGPCLYQASNGGETWSESFKSVTSPPVEEAFREFLDPGARPVTPLSEQLSRADESCAGSDVHVASATGAWLTVGCFSGGFAVLKTEDAGQTWDYAWGTTSCLMGCQTGNNGRFPLFFLDATRAWRQASGYAIGSTSDAGQTWTESPPVDPSSSWCCDNAVFVDASHGWVIVGEAAIAVTTDGGLTWETFQPAFA